MKRIIILLFVVLLFLVFPSEGKERKICFGVPLKEAPVLDGKLEEGIWGIIPTGSGFYVLATDDPASEEAVFKVGYTGEAIYFGVRCFEPDANKVRAKFTDMGPVYNDDSVELFILTDGTEPYFHFIVNTESCKFNGRGQEGAAQLWDWEAKSYKGRDFWSLEVKIPFKLLGKVPREGEIWRINVARNDLTSPGGQNSSWSYIPDVSFHSPGHFESLAFLGPSYSKEIMEKQFVVSLINEELNPVLKSSFVIVEELSEKKDDKRFTREVRLLSDKLKPMENKLKKDNISLKKMNSLINESESIQSGLQALETKYFMEKYFFKQ